MSKVVGPLLSIGARGQIAKSQVYSAWRGIKYVRRYVIPANPKTTEQEKTRNVFSAATAIFGFMGSLARAPWDAAVKGRPFFGRNFFTSKYVKGLRGAAMNDNIVMSPGANGGFPLTDLTASTGTSAGEVDATATPPDPPTDWVLASVTFTILPNQDPTTIVAEPVDEATVTSSPWQTTFSGLTTGSDYLVSAWPVWTKPDGSTAYGASRNAIATAD